MKVLITGGAGYVGSTVASACIDAGIIPVILDDLSTGCAAFVRDRVFYVGDVGDASVVDRIFSDHPEIFAVVHCAAKVNVAESMERPLLYYRANVAKSRRLLSHLIANGCQRIVYASSASIYAPTDSFVVDEEADLGPTSPYARTKIMAERILNDAARSNGIRVISLRYFNAIGADRQMRTGPQDTSPSHVLGKLIDAVNADREFLIAGADWPTRDGSGLRDYVHVWDLAQAHVRALENFDLAASGGDDGYLAVNIGSGQGTTVRELVAAFERATNKPVLASDSNRRLGDGPGIYACIDLAKERLGWQPKLSLTDGICDAVRWFEARDRVLSGASP